MSVFNVIKACPRVACACPADKSQGCRHCSCGFEYAQGRQGLCAPENIGAGLCYACPSSGSCATSQVPLQRVLVVYDDMDVASGTVRLRAKGGHGGHNGMRSITQHFSGSKEFPRVRLGMRPFHMAHSDVSLHHPCSACHRKVASEGVLTIALMCVSSISSLSDDVGNSFFSGWPLTAQIRSVHDAAQDV